MLPPAKRTWMDQLALQYRLVRTSSAYNSNCPSDLSVHQRLKLHFSHLQLYWSRIVELQKVVGLEAAHFSPEDQFELIFVVTEKISHDLAESAASPFGETREKWEEYKRVFESLSYEINPFEFAERCSKCALLLARITLPKPAQEALIPLEESQLLALQGRASSTSGLRMVSN